VKNFEDFIRILDTPRVNTKDILASIGIISLFPKVPIRVSLNFLSKQFDKNNVRLFR
jgi:hypothetical protein